MKLIRHLDNLPEAFLGGVVAIGNFDGVHLGHARIVARLLRNAHQTGGQAIVFTLDPHPAAILRPQQAPLPLTTVARKAQLLGDLGVDAVIAYPTDAALLALSPWEFFAQVLMGRMRIRGLVEGYNFNFGRNRAGDVRALAEYCGQAGIALEVVGPVEVDGQVISSSRIRQLLGQGAVEQAGRMLTEPYRIAGLVVHGAGRGRQLGYPTANLHGIETLLPGGGIYAGLAWVDGRAWPAAISVGPNPTFDEAAMKTEVHLIGFNGSLYDRPLEVDFLARLRDIQRFGSADELIRQMDRDIADAQQIAAQAA